MRQSTLNTQLSTRSAQANKQVKLRIENIRHICSAIQYKNTIALQLQYKKPRVQETPPKVCRSKTIPQVRPGACMGIITSESETKEATEAKRAYRPLAAGESLCLMRMERPGGRCVTQWRRQPAVRGRATLGHQSHQEGQSTYQYTSNVL